MQSAREHSAIALIRLIHEVNPTSRNLDWQTEKQLYILKNRLQSLLIKLHSEDLEVRADSSANTDTWDLATTIELFHRPLGRDACHAVVSDLSDDAKFWVRKFLDEELFEKRSISRQAPQSRFTKVEKVNKVQVDNSSPTPEWRKVDDLLSKAREAVHEYDYDKAATLLLEALDLSGGSLESGLALLELLVDTLGNYEQALTIESKLSSSSIRHERIRQLLAASAVEMGDYVKAEAFLMGVADSKCASIYLKMARTLIEKGDIPSCERFLRYAQKIGLPTAQDDVDDIKAKIINLKSKRFKSLEDDLLKCFEAEDWMRVREMLDKIVLDFPESSVARRVRAELEQRDRNIRYAHLIQKICDARSHNDITNEYAALKVVLGFYAEASPNLSLDSADEFSPDSIKQRLNEIERERTEFTLLETYEKIKTIQNKNGLQAALREFLTTGDKAQVELESWFSEPAYAWARKLAANASIGKRARIAEALSALVDIINDQSSPSAVRMQRLKVHDQALDGLDAYRTIYSRLEKEIEVIRRESALHSFDTGNQLMDAKKWSEALQVFEALNPRDVSFESIGDGSTVDLENLIEKCRQMFELEGRALWFCSLVEKAEWLSALKVGRELYHDHQGKESYQEHIKAIEGQVAKLWAIQVFNNSPPLDFFRHAINGHRKLTPESTLSPDGNNFELVRSVGKWLFVVTFLTKNSSVHETCVIKLPTPMNVESSFFDGLYLTIYGSGGEVLKLQKYPQWTVWSYSTVAKRLLDQRIIDDVHGESNGRYALIETRTKVGEHQWDETLIVIDVEREDIIRTRLNANVLFDLPDIANPRFVYTRFAEKKMYLLNARGLIERQIDLDKKMSLDTVAIHPVSGEIVLGILMDSMDIFSDEGEPNHDENGIRIYIWGENQLREAFVLKNAYSDMAFMMVSNRSHNALTLHYQSEDGTNLATLVPTEQGFEQLWNVSAPDDIVAITDIQGNRSALLYMRYEQPQIDFLTRTQPDDDTFNWWSDKEAPQFPSFNFDYSSCDRIHGPLKALALVQTMAMKKVEPEKIRSWLERQKKENGHDPDHLCAIFIVLGSESRYVYMSEVRDSLFVWIKSHFPEHPFVIYQSAINSSRETEFGTVRELLEEQPLDFFHESLRNHVCHMLGAAQYNQGEFDLAYTTWNRSVADLDDASARCPIGRFQQLEKFSKSPGVTDELLSEGGSDLGIADYLRVLLAADLLMEKDAFKGAWSIFARLGPLYLFNTQIHARFAKCVLGMIDGKAEFDDLIKPIEAIYFLAKYCSDFEESVKSQKEHPKLRRPDSPLPPPFTNLSKNNLNDIYLRSTSWLESRECNLYTKP